MRSSKLRCSAAAHAKDSRGLLSAVNGAAIHEKRGTKRPYECGTRPVRPASSELAVSVIIEQPDDSGVYHPVAYESC